MKQTVLITGAGRGIGRAIAERFLSAGTFQVVGLARHTGNDGFPILACDVTVPSAVEACVRQVWQDYGSIDILVNCAGAGLGGALEDFSYEQLAFELNLNVVGTANVIKTVLPYMRRQGRGRILSVGSVAGHIAIPFQAMYSASKAALHSITDALRLELAGSGIQVCIVEPGDTKTSFTDSRQYAAGIAENPYYKIPCQRALNQMIFDERHGKSPATVAETVLRLCRKRKMPAYRVVGGGYRVLCGLARILPGPVVAWILTLIYLKSKKDGGFSYPSPSQSSPSSEAKSS